MPGWKRAAWTLVVCAWAIGFQLLTTPELPLWRNLGAALALVGLCFSSVLLLREIRERRAAR